MLGIDHHPGQARRVEQALVEIELPGARLLRQQAALQPVGEAADHALQAQQLLVELAAQARELDGLHSSLASTTSSNLRVNTRYASASPPGRQILRHLVGRLAVAVLLGALRRGVVEVVLAGARLGALVRAGGGVGIARGVLVASSLLPVAGRIVGAGVLLLLARLALVGILLLGLLAEVLGEAEMRASISRTCAANASWSVELPAERRPVLAGRGSRA